MRILLLNQYYAPDEAATAQLLADVGEGLVHAGHEVEVVCSRRSYATPSRRYVARECIDGVRVRRARSTGFGRTSRVGRLVDYLTFLVAATAIVLCRRRPDAILALSTPPMVAGLGWLAARARGARSVYWVMDVYPELAYQLGVLRRGSWTGRALERLSRFLLRRSDQVVALGECMATRLDVNQRDHIHVIHNWADGKAIRPKPPAESRLRIGWGWHGKFVVLYSGNMGLAHEFDTVLAAAERLSRHPEVLFAFVGGGPRRAEVEQEVLRRRLRNVEFRPYTARSDLGESLTAGDVHLATLREGVEGMLVPSKIYGILAAGRPTLYVGPPDGEIFRIVRGGRCGVWVSTGSGDALADAILRYRNDPAKLQSDGQRARELFDDQFSKERGVRTFLSLFAAMSKAPA